MNGEILRSIILPAAGLAATLAGWGIISAVLTIIARRRQQSEASGLGPVLENEPVRLTPISEAALKTRSATAWTIATPLIYAVALGALVPTNIADTGSHSIIGYAAGGMGMWCIAAFRWRMSVRRQREIQWLHDARIVMEDAIRPLAGRGYHVFKDFKVDNVAVDYLLVGPKGVFALQLLVRAVDSDIEQRTDATVTYDGRTLFFPQGKDYESIEAANNQAEALSEWLSERLEAPVAARAILALPGWQIKRISADGISVINPSQLEALFQYIKPRPLEAVEINSIVERISRYHDPSADDQNITSLSETTF